MATSNTIKNIAIIGASGNVGTQALKHLIAANRFNITVITRADGSATFQEHSSVTVKKGAYDSPDFLKSAFTSQDAVIFALGFMATGKQPAMIQAAIEAGVEWIIPNEYAGDGSNDAMVDKVPLFWPKREARKQIEKLSAENGGKAKWIGVATNPWAEFSMQTGMFGVNIYKKTATLHSDAGFFNISTLDQVGKGIAALLSLPITNEDNPRASLSHYANNYVYISSALVTQRQLFEAAQRATGTKAEDWEVSESTCAERLRVAEEKFKGGDMFAGADGTYAMYMGEGKGGNYEEKAKADREVLELREEDGVDGIAKRAVEMPPPTPFK